MLKVQANQAGTSGYVVRVDAANSDEKALAGGNASASVVRVGDTVRKPWLQTTGLTVGYMRALRARGIDLPEPRGRDDLATWNLVIDGERLVFIDWDGSGPSTRLWDLAYAAISFGHLFAGQDLDAAVGRLVAFLDGYDADDLTRTALPTMMTQRARAMHDLLRRSHESGRQPWGPMYVEGHGEHWSGATAFIAQHEQAWGQALA